MKVCCVIPDIFYVAAKFRDKVSPDAGKSNFTCVFNTAVWGREWYSAMYKYNIRGEFLRELGMKWNKI